MGTAVRDGPAARIASALLHRLARSRQFGQSWRNPPFGRRFRLPGVAIRPSVLELVDDHAFQTEHRILVSAPAPRQHVRIIRHRHGAMTSGSVAILTLSLYALVAIVLIVRDALTCVDGWRVWVLHIIARLYTPLMFRQRISGTCPLPGRGGGLVISNHRSPVDPILVFSGSVRKQDGGGPRSIDYLTAREYCELGGPLGWITRVMQVIPVARSGEDMGAVKVAVRRLKQGRLVGVFPEGRINLESGLLPANPGVAWLALHARAPVYPVYIHNSPQGESMVQPFHTFSRVRLCYGRMIDLSEYYGRRLTPELLQEVTDHLMARLAAAGRDEGVREGRVPPPLRLAPASRAG